jgi:8-oxo-dGTP pyrophosphatase MutT (NUDIX family)
VVFRRVDGQVEFALMLDSYGKWAFPKGHVERGESVEEAAARETLEELGLIEIRLLESLGTIDIWFRDRYEKKGVLIHKDIHYFLFETKPNAELHPDAREHAYDAKWVRPESLLEASSYSDMVPVLRRALAYVEGPTAR